jgi:2-keto-4-pentenoate hydratase
MRIICPSQHKPGAVGAGLIVARAGALSRVAPEARLSAGCARPNPLGQPDSRSGKNRVTLRQRMLALALALAAVPLGTLAACPSDLDTALIAARYANLQPAPNPAADLTMIDALCGRDKFTRFLGQNCGKVVGYKAGLTNPAVQKRFNYPNPVRGTLFEKMLLQDGAEVPAKFGARPLFEADMVMEVKDAAINQATTPLEALRHVARIYPFIELPDLVVEDPSKITGPSLVYSNVGARLGVLGRPIEVKATPELVEALANMTVKLLDQDGKELDSSKGSAILGQPLNAVLWLVKDLNDSGIALKKGDLLSLGSFSRLLPPKAGTGATMMYQGLPGNPSVGVRFK